MALLIISDISDAIDNAEISRRNYALRTEIKKSGYYSYYDLYDLSVDTFSFNAGDNVYLSFNWEVTNPSVSSKFRINRVVGFSDGTNDQWDNMFSNIGDLSTSAGKGRAIIPWKWSKTTNDNVSKMRLVLNQTVDSGTITIMKLKMGKGNGYPAATTDWSPAPEDYPTLSEFNALAARVAALEP